MVTSSTESAARRHRITHSSAPFGHPDGSSGNLHEVQSSFVDFSRSAAASGLASRPDDRTVRVLVGKKGVGKTIYLRRFQASASEEDSVFAADRESNPPATEDIVRVSQLYDTNTVTEAWRLIWRRAIQRSVVSDLLCKKRLRETIEPEVIDHLARDFLRLVPECKTPRPIYADVTDIIALAHTAHRLNEYLKHREWVELEYWLGRALRDSPPIHLYIDAVDDHFQRAPMYWLKCQKGLFLEVMALREDDIAKHLHVVVCIRDLVLSSVLRGEHASRYRHSLHVRVLDWDYETIRFLLQEKIRRLDRDFRLQPSRDGVEGWLGRTTIDNHARGFQEDVEDYLLRHTRLIPRDVVVLGNALSRQVAAVRAAGGRELPEDVLRVCANQIAADHVPAHGARNGVVDYFIGSHEYSDGTAKQLTDLLGEIGRDRFDYETVMRLAQRGRDKLDGYDHLPDVLWQNGLLGYDSPEPGATHADFYASGEDDAFHLPGDKTSYVFHSCIPHLVRMEHTGETPVRAYRKS
jgi:hypothetical protein